MQYQDHISVNYSSFSVLISELFLFDLFPLEKSILLCTKTGMNKIK